MVITSVQNTKIKELSKLKEKKYRDIEKKYLIEGFHLIEMAKDYLLEILTTDSKNIPSNIDLNKVNVTIVSDEVIKKLAFTKTPQPIIGVCKYFDSNINYNETGILLDNLQDPGNIGTILRSALAFNINNIILSKDSVDIYNDKVIRASQGAIYKLNISYLNLLDAINNYKNKEIKVFGTSLHNGKELTSFNKVSKYALVLGNEGNGVSKELLDKADNNIFIEMEDKIDSLNVSIAGAIIMHYFYK